MRLEPATPLNHLSDNLPDVPDASQPAGLYIHVPFCQSKCAYCDFYSVTRLNRIDDYLNALLIEIDRCQHAIPVADSIYFGGGTPSILPPSQVAKVLDAIQTRFPVSDDVEITLEVNPGTVNKEDLRSLRQSGVNRLNIGLQSLDDHRLASLGRIHTAQAGCMAYDWARSAGFDNVGLDLIYATPGQTLRSWEKEMAGVVCLKPDHLACYTLTVEHETPLARQVENGQQHLLDEQTVGDLFDATGSFLQRNGYRWYEVSNFDHWSPGSPDRRSRHNRKYWNAAPYLGFGPAAHSFLDHTRWWNHRSLDDYLADLSAGKRPVTERETLTRDQQIIESIYLGLRQTEGIDTTRFAARFNVDFHRHFVRPIDTLVQDGLLETSSERVRLTRHGMRFLESVVGRMLG